MINEERGKETVILFLGDHHQTPPPSETRKSDTDSPTFKYTGANLTIPFRYGGDIQELATSVADEIDLVKGRRTFKFLVPFTKRENADYKFTRNGPEFFTDFVNTYHNDEDKIHGSILVSYRNRVTSELSRNLRKQILNENSKKLLIGAIIGMRRCLSIIMWPIFQKRIENQGNI